MDAIRCVAAAVSALVVLSGCATEDGASVAPPLPRNSPSHSSPAPESWPSHPPDMEPADTTPSARPDNNAGERMTPDDPPTDAGSGTTVVVPTSFGELPVPVTGDDAVALLRSMPERIEDWEVLTTEPDGVMYDHPSGLLGIGAGEIADMYPMPKSAGETVRLLRKDLDDGHGVTCAAPPAHCVIGRLEGMDTLLWGHDESQVLMAMTWPDSDARAQLLEAWSSLR